jgi:uncharacterized protein YihD (DUF1040 family)
MNITEDGNKDKGKTPQGALPLVMVSGTAPRRVPQGVVVPPLGVQTMPRAGVPAAGTAAGATVPVTGAGATSVALPAVQGGGGAVQGGAMAAAPFEGVDFTDRGGMNLVDFLAKTAKPYDFEKELQQARRQQMLGTFGDILTLAGQSLGAARGARQFTSVASNAPAVQRIQALQDAATQQKMAQQKMLQDAAVQQYIMDANAKMKQAQAKYEYYLKAWENERDFEQKKVLQKMAVEAKRELATLQGDIQAKRDDRNNASRAAIAERNNATRMTIAERAQAGADRRAEIRAGVDKNSEIIPGPNNQKFRIPKNEYKGVFGMLAGEVEKDVAKNGNGMDIFNAKTELRKNPERFILKYMSQHPYMYSILTPYLVPNDAETAAEIAADEVSAQQAGLMMPGATGDFMPAPVSAAGAAPTSSVYDNYEDDDLDFFVDRDEYVTRR